jgi:general L-amino acid transport system permease protein
LKAAYTAEVIRGGLQALPRGQYDAAKSLGMGYWRLHLLVILPQALKLVIPGIANTFFSFSKRYSFNFCSRLIGVSWNVKFSKNKS